MGIFGRHFLSFPLGVLILSIGLLAQADGVLAQNTPQNSPSSPSSGNPLPGEPSEQEEPIPSVPADLPPLPPVPATDENRPIQAEGQSEEPMDVPRGPTAAEEILAPLESGPTAEEEILAPLEEVAVTGDILEGVSSQEYVVQEGDTLWDITQTYFSDSFLWPKIWRSNKSILNPDLIFPGNIILIPGDPNAPLIPPPVVSRRPVSGVPPVPTPTPAQKKGPSTELPEEHRIEVVHPEDTLSDTASMDLSTLPNPGYMVTKEERMGKIVGARDGRNIIGEGETTYLRPRRGKRPAIGDRFTVYRVVRKVEHPKTGKNIGKLIRILGTVEIVDSKPKEKTVTATVVDSLDFMKAGDLLMPLIFRETSNSVSFSTRPETPLVGFILDVKENRISQAEHDIVFLDRGRQHGLKIGNRLMIVRDGKRTPIISPGRGVRLPSRTIGQIQVISVQDITATALILKSSEVIIRGDRFETPPKP